MHPLHVLINDLRSSLSVMNTGFQRPPRYLPYLPHYQSCFLPSSIINSSLLSSRFYAFSKAWNRTLTRSLYVLVSGLRRAVLITSTVAMVPVVVMSCTLLHGRAASCPLFLQSAPQGHWNLERVSDAGFPFSAHTRLTVSVRICATVDEF